MILSIYYLQNWIHRAYPKADSGHTFLRVIDHLASAAAGLGEAIKDQQKHPVRLEQVIGCSVYATPVLQLYGFGFGFIVGAIPMARCLSSAASRWGGCWKSSRRADRSCSECCQMCCHSKGQLGTNEGHRNRGRWEVKEGGVWDCPYTVVTAEGASSVYHPSRTGATRGRGYNPSLKATTHKAVSSGQLPFTLQTSPLWMNGKDVAWVKGTVAHGQQLVADSDTHTHTHDVMKS